MGGDASNDVERRPSTTDMLGMTGLMATQHQTVPFEDRQHSRAGSWDAPGQRIPAVDRDESSIKIVEKYLASIRRMSTPFPSSLEGSIAGCKRGLSALYPLHNPFHSCTTDPACWPSVPAREDTSGGCMPLPGQQSKRQRSCRVADQEDVAESMPWGPAEASACVARPRDHSSISAASTHWQVQIWPQPTFKLHKDVLEDDATSPLSAPCSEQE
ncbi:hypothetical protein WJX75_004675 [Coccomyxa subellipsoidea]|uniref:Uncharacterized protein n=1 Tax=Coccomyxa subellipsoidea TaxID=248742 RepID=A0ABR2YHZ6_9CHLO